MEKVDWLIKGMKWWDVYKKQKIDDELWKMVGIYSENREEWTITELACMSDHITIVPIFVNNSQDIIEAIIN